MKLLQIVYTRLSDISYCCLCLSTDVITVFKSNKLNIVKILTKFFNKIIHSSIKKQLLM